MVRVTGVEPARISPPEPNDTVTSLELTLFCLTNAILMKEKSDTEANLTGSDVQYQLGKLAWRFVHPVAEPPAYN